LIEKRTLLEEGLVSKMRHTLICFNSTVKGKTNCLVRKLLTRTTIVTHAHIGMFAIRFNLVLPPLLDHRAICLVCDV
jgi:hypothetical protein